MYFVLQVWSDWKTKTKKKASLINRDIRGTGGGPGRGKPLSRLEERVLRVIGVTAITGSQAIQEAGFQVSEPSYIKLFFCFADFIKTCIFLVNNGLYFCT